MPSAHVGSNVWTRLQRSSERVQLPDRYNQKSNESGHQRSLLGRCRPTAPDVLEPGADFIAVTGIDTA